VVAGPDIDGDFGFRAVGFQNDFALADDLAGNELRVNILLHGGSSNY
jgi:hypothetical protein